MVALATPTERGVDLEDAEWMRLVAFGLLVDAPLPETVTRLTGVTELAARAAIEMAERAGILDDDTVVDTVTAAKLVDTLSDEDLALAEKALGRRLLTADRDELPSVIAMCRSAAPRLNTEHIASMSQHGGELNLATRRYRSARVMLELAVDLDGGNNPSSLAERLLSLAVALDGTGDLDASREVLARAASLGIVAGDADLTARAAVKYALPSDWFSGDHRAIELLKRAEQMNPSAPMLAAVIAARGLVEMRIPVVHEDENQYAWITRPETARSFTEQALEMASAEYDYERAVALLAWRGTHRAPRFLSRRRSATTELLEIAHRIADPWILVMAAEWSAVDHIESGDRVAYDKAVATSRWAAEHDGNPRLRWRSLATAAGGAYLDWQPDVAQQHLAEAAAALAKTSSPCWIGAEILFAGEEVISRDDPNEMAQHLNHDSVATQLNPLAQAGFAYICARGGDPAAGQTFLEKSWRALDEESSMLLHAARLAAAAIQLGDRARMEALIDLLTPCSEHVVVDAHGWWIDGPVASWLAHLHAGIDDTEGAVRHLQPALELARSINDVRSLRRLDRLSRRLGHEFDLGIQVPLVDPGLLGEREMDVLRLMAEGKTNAEIANTLAFSVSTIRNSTVEIYRRLGVKGRADAVARAHQLGLLGD